MHYPRNCENKYVFVTSDSTYALSKKFGYYYDINKSTRDTLQAIYDSDVHLNILFSDDCMQEKNAISNFSEACSEYKFGVYSKSKTGYFANDAYAKIYSDAVIDLKTLPLMYTCSVSPNTIPAEVERNAFINSLPKSIDSSKVPTADANGNIDFKNAADKVGAKFESLYSACDKSALTRKGYEQLMENQKKSVSLITGSVQITPFSDKLLYADSDGDTIPDKWDLSPNIPINSNFKLINNLYDYGIDDLISDAYQETIENAKNSYKSIDGDWQDGFTDEFLNYCMVLGGETVLSRTVLNFDTIFESGIKLGATPYGAMALNHYLQNSGKDYIVPLYIPLGLHKTQRTKYYNQLNSFFEMAEQTLKPQKTYCFATTTTPDSTWSVNYHERNAISGQVADDMWLTFGGANNALIAEVIGENINGRMHYCSKIKYYIYDFYDWDGTEEEALANLHKLGKAKSFRTIGLYSFELEWDEGARYPLNVNSEYPLSMTKFDEIEDNEALKKAYDYGKKYYDDLNCGGVIEW